MNLSKEKIALISVLTGFILTLIKGIAGILTSSLGLLSESLHSFFDFGAALFAFFSIKISAKPADEKHTFGHGKVENLSALFQSFFLFITSIWIIYESVQRIFLKKVEVKANFLAFSVILISIILSALLSRLLKKGSIYYKSQALEADGLHYTSDVYSSFVVLLGLIFTKYGFSLFDSIAAIFVAILILFATYKLSLKAIFDLMDTYPEEVREIAKNILKTFESIKEIEKMRVRKSGPTIFMELTLKTKPSFSVLQSHELSKEIEDKLKENIKELDLIIHFHPAEEKEKLHEKIQDIAKNFSEIENIHKIYLYKNKETKKYTLCFDVVFLKSKNLEETHKLLDDFEKKVREKIPEIEEIHSHIEKKRETFEGKVEKLQGEVFEKIENELKKDKNIIDLHDVYLYKEEKGTSLSCHLLLNKNLDINEAHKISTKAENIIRNTIKDIKNVTIHTEPSP